MSKPNKENDKFFLKLVKDGKIKVFKTGEIINLKTNKKIGTSVDSRGYPKLAYQDSKSKKIYQIQTHRLVYLVHKGTIPGDKIINHKDGKKTNVNISNLELMSVAENNRHARKIGLNKG
jgi:hypothetical protein